MKKFFVAFLCVIMVMVFMPTMVFAAEGETMTEQDFMSKVATGTVDLEGKTVTLTSPLTVNGELTISNGTIVGPDGDYKVIIAYNENAAINLNNVSIVAGNGAETAILAGNGSTLVANNLTVDHTNAARGGAVIVNTDANADFTGNLTMNLSANSWYGVNVDAATADFTGAMISATTPGATQSAVCIDDVDNAEVTGVVLTKVSTATEQGADGQPQVAYVTDANLSTFVAAKTSGGSKVTNIELLKDVELSQPLFLSEAIVLNGNGHTITGPAGIEENVVTVTADSVTVQDVTIKTVAANKSALHVYKAKGVLVEDVTLDTTTTAGGAGIIVNGSDVVASGLIKFINGENTWGGVNIDTKVGAASLTFDDNATVTTEGVEKDVIYQDAGQEAATITGAEDAGLVKNDDGSYAVKDESTPDDSKDDPVNPPVDDEQKPVDDEKDPAETTDEEVPKTSDANNMLPWLIIMAAAATGAAGLKVRKNK